MLKHHSFMLMMQIYRCGTHLSLLDKSNMFVFIDLLFLTFRIQQRSKFKLSKILMYGQAEASGYTKRKVQRTS